MKTAGFRLLSRLNNTDTQLTMSHFPQKARKGPSVETLPDTQQTGLRTKTFRKNCVDFHWHFHPEIELIHIRKGSGVCHMGNSVQPFAPGSFYLIGTNLPHAFGSSPDQRRGAEWTVAHFLPSVWGEAFWTLPGSSRIVQLLQLARHGLQFDPQETETIKKSLEETTSKTGIFRMTGWLEILERLAHCPHQLLNPVPISESKIDERLEVVLAWLENNAADSEMRQAEAAEKVHMSPAAFCRFFRMSTGRPFHRYVNEVRVARACGSLLGNQHSIADIAFKAGFGNLANFNRRFREIAGMTPREYRRSQGH